MYCTRCGSPIEGAAFCTTCGTPAQPKQNSALKIIVFACAAIAIFVAGIFTLSFLGKTNKATSAQQTSQNESAERAATPRPTPTPLTAAILMNKVRADVTPELIAGNASKYVGTYVLIQCQIVNVIGSGDDKEANASCSGDSGEGEASRLVIAGDVGNLDTNQNVTILGQVTEPSEGTNSFGASSSFPTVRLMFLNPSTQDAQTSGRDSQETLPGNAQEKAVAAFYNNITQRNFDAAYAGLSNAYRSNTSRAQFESGYVTTISVFAAATRRSDDANTVDVVLNALDSKNGQTVHTTFVGVWHLIQDANGTWLLDNGQFKKQDD